MGRRSISWMVLLSLGGCGQVVDRLRKPAPTDSDEVYSTPTGDGSHYIAVFSEPTTPQKSMQRRWNKHATKVCEGDYMVLAEHGSERRQGGFVESRAYEGWVRCLSPDVTLEEAEGNKAEPPPKPAVADRSAPRLFE